MGFLFQVQWEMNKILVSPRLRHYGNFTQRIRIKHLQKANTDSYHQLESETWGNNTKINSLLTILNKTRLK